MPYRVHHLWWVRGGVMGDFPDGMSDADLEHLGSGAIVNVDNEGFLVADPRRKSVVVLPRSTTGFPFPARYAGLPPESLRRRAEHLVEQLDTQLTPGWTLEVVESWWPIVDPSRKRTSHERIIQAPLIPVGTKTKQPLVINVPLLVCELVGLVMCASALMFTPVHLASFVQEPLAGRLLTGLWWTGLALMTGVPIVVSLASWRPAEPLAARRRTITDLDIRWLLDDSPSLAVPFYRAHIAIGDPGKLPSDTAKEYSTIMLRLRDTALERRALDPIPSVSEEKDWKSRTTTASEEALVQFIQSQETANR